ncbi:unnamed protein product [Phyllotreta striolata]|uniref:Odorant receptor n=1 Tax=Phyllotreta striolata TaxID=444603 RepID=A0A9N9TTX8_PHYSR|nr:unnamed protein product [Phyllotreta striolata]
MLMESNIVIFIYELFFAKRPNRNYVANIVGIINSQPFIIMAFINPYFVLLFKNIERDLAKFCGSLTTEDANFNRTISREILKTKFTFFGLAVLLFLCNYINAVFNLKGEMKIYLVISYILEYTNEMATTIMLLSMVTALSCHAVVSLSFIIYCIAHVICQIRLLRYLLQDSLNNLSHSIDDENYQNYIGEILKFCAKHHNSIAYFNNYYLSLMQMPILVLTALGGVAIAVNYYFVYAKTDPFYDTTMYCNIGMSLILITTYTHYGQLLADESENLYNTLCDTPWIHWNKQNRQMLQIMMVNSMEPLKISLIQGQTFNYAYNLSVLQTCYSVFTLATSL